MPPSLSSSVHLILILLLAPLILASTTSPCYYPDGSYQSYDSPCFPEQAQSFCCGQGHSCMSNGLCRWPDADMPAPLAYIRGSCTDQTWLSSACPPHCANVLPSEWDVIIECPNNEFCCSPNNADDQTCCTANSTAPSATASASATIFTLDIATTVTVIGASSYPPTNTGTAIAAPSISTGNSGPKIGIGVGVGVGVSLVLALCAWVIWRKRNSRLSQRQNIDRSTGRLAMGADGVGEERKEPIAELASTQIHVNNGKVLEGANVGIGVRAELEGRGKEREAELPG